MYAMLIGVAVVFGTQAIALQLPPAITAPPCVACRVDSASNPDTYSPEKWRALTRGEILTAEGRQPAQPDQRNVEAAAIFHYPPAQVWAVVSDFESRPKYAPNTKEVHILRIDGNRVWVSEYMRVLLMNVRFGLICTFDPEHGSVSWILDRNADNDIADTAGSWQLVPLTDGRETLVTYRTWIDSGKAVPGFIQTFLFKRTLPQLMAGVRDEVRRRFPPETEMRALYNGGHDDNQ